MQPAPAQALAPPAAVAGGANAERWHGYLARALRGVSAPSAGDRR